MRALVLALLLTAIWAAPAAAQRDDMHLGERLGAQVVRAGAPAGPPPIICVPPTSAPATREPLPITDRVSTEKKGAH